MKILGIDSSAKSASVAILDNDKMLGEFFVNASLTHSQTLLPMVDLILKSTVIDIKDIDLFAVSSGPGSYTGVRIGISAVKGMAMALNKPCVGVSTLQSMCVPFIDRNCIVCATMDARCNQLYNAIFKMNNGNIKRLTEDRIILINDLETEITNYKDSIILVGDGASLCYNTFNLSKHDNIKLALEKYRYQSGYGVAVIGKKMFEAGKSVSAENIFPVYLRLSQAERELNKKQNKLLKENKK